MNFDIQNELCRLSERQRGAISRLAQVGHLYPGQFEIGHTAVPSRRTLVRPEDLTIQIKYQELISSLKEKRRHLECLQTYAERRFAHELALATAKDVHCALWIGASCIDLFIPNVRSKGNGKRVMKGLAIEIDGDSHNYETKMRKDEVKGLMLKCIGIGQTSVANWDLNCISVRNLIEQLKSLRPLDSRDRRRLWRRIQLLTLAAHLPDREFFGMFTPPIGTRTPLVEPREWVK